MEPVHHRGTGEGFRQEDGVGMAATHISDQPLPERQRLGVGIVDAERAHALTDPEQHDVAQRLPQAGQGTVGIEVDIDDVLVLLGRVLGVFDGSVGSMTEPFGMLTQPGMIGRALDGEVERDLEAMIACGRDQSAEILERPERGMQRVVTAFAAADGVRTADILRRGDQAVVASLAGGHADRMDGREIKNVEAHVAYAGQALDHIGEGAVARRIVGLGARKKLVPAREARLAPIDVERDRLVLHGEGPRPGIGDDLDRRRRDQSLDARLHVAFLEDGQSVGQRRSRAGLARDRLLEREPHFSELDGDVDAGLALQADAAAERGVVVEPGLDGE